MKEGWKYGTLKDFCNVNYGTRVVRSNVTGNKYPVYGGGGETFRMDDYNREDCLVVSRFAMSKQCTRIVKGKFFLNDSGLTVSPKDSSALNPKLLDRFLLASNDLIYSYGRGSAQINLNVDAFKNMLMAFPISLTEQQSIVDYLDFAFAKIDAMKANSEKALNEAKALFQASLKELLEPKEGWITSTLKDECYKITDGTHQTPKYYPSGYIFLSSKNVTSRKIDWENVKYIDESQHQIMHQRVAPKVGDILLAKNGTTGVAAMVDRDIIFDIYVSLALLRSKGNVTPEYLLTFVNSPIAKEQFNKRLIGMGVPNLHLGEINQVVITYPKDKKEQAKMIQKIDEIDNLIIRLQANFDKITQECEALKQAILRQVFE